MRDVIIGAGWLWGVLALPSVTDAGMDFFVAILLLLSGGAIGFAWAVYSTWVPGVFRTRRIRWLWLSVPVIGLGVLILSFTDEGLVVRVWLCDSRLREVAEIVRQDPSRVSCSRGVGLFSVHKTTADEKQVFFHTSDELFSSSGIVYRPDGEPPEYNRGYRSLGRVRHLYGPWWKFYMSED